MEFIESDQLLHCTGNVVSVEKATKGKRIILLYFGSAGEASCRQFLPILKQIYQKAIELRLRLEIIYASFDKDEDVMRKHFMQRHGPWYALLPGDPAIWILRTIYQVSHIPMLIVLGKDGIEISRNGTGDIEQLGLDVLVAWNDTPPT